MFGNKYAGDELAKSFKKTMEQLNSLKKKASEAKDFKASDFLVKDNKDTGPDVNRSMDQVLDQLKSYIKDDKCAKCNKVHDMAYDCMAKDEKSCPNCNKVHDMAYDCKAKDGCSNCGDGSYAKDAKPNMPAHPMSPALDAKSSYVLAELSKIAKDLRVDGKGFAADMVLATAKEIKEEAIFKAAQQEQVIVGLKKMAKESYAEGDRMTGDVILATIRNIKKG
jgi:hypothetical protein